MGWKLSERGIGISPFAILDRDAEQMYSFNRGMGRGWRYILNLGIWEGTIKSVPNLPDMEAIIITGDGDDGQGAIVKMR